MLLTLAAFFFVLSVVVFVHELGHFVVAKINGIYVVTFSFGFGPKLLKRRVGETEYAISALPFGGYVKFAGETEEPEPGPDAPGGAPAPPREPEVPPGRMYRNKAPWQRMLVVLAGPVMNLLLALFVYIFSLYIGGLGVDPSTAIQVVEAGWPAAEAGMRPGDEILAIDGKRVAYWAQIQRLLSRTKDAPMHLTVLRGADTIGVDVRPRFDAAQKMWRIGIGAELSARIGDVKRDSPAARAGLRRGATVLAINDTTITTFSQMEDRITRSLGVPMKFTWKEGGAVRSAVITPVAGEAAAGGERLDVVKVGQIGVSPYYEMVRISIGEAIEYGSTYLWNMTVSIVDFLGKLFTGQATLRAIGGPLRVGKMAGEMVRWGFNYLVSFLAFFSLNLAIFNLFPILPFDGGHFVLGLVEWVSRRRIGKRVQLVLTQAGFVLLILLMVFIFAVDIFNLTR